MQKDLVSVIIPCYNAEKFIGDCVKSLVNQTYKNFEAIFVDDGSADGTFAKLNGLCKTLPNFKVIGKANAGVSAARNTAIGVANGEYFSFLDSDDMYRPDFLEVMLGFLKDNGLDIAICTYKRVKENFGADGLKAKKIKATAKFFTDAEDAACRVLTNSNLEFSPCIKLIRREVFERAGVLPYMFNEDVRYGEDGEFSYRCLSNSLKTGVINERLYLYRTNGNSLCRTVFNKNQHTVFTGMNAVIADAENKFPKCVNYAKAYAGVMAMEMLWRMHRAKYYDGKKINETFCILKENMQYITSCKYHPWWRRLFSPLVPGFFKIIYGKRLKG